MVPPVPYLLAGFACGVVALQQCAHLPSHPIALAVASVGLAWVFAVAKRASTSMAARASALLALTLSAGALGFGYAAIRAEHRLSDALPRAWEGVDIHIVGVVDDLPHTSDQGVRFAFALEKTVTPGATVPTRVSLTWPATQGRDMGQPSHPEIHAGERWMLAVRLRRPHGNVNPSGFDLEAWMLERNLRASGYVRAHEVNRRLTAFAGRPADHVQRARESIRARIVAALPNARYAGVLVALAMGDQRSIPESQWLTFNRTGVAHLVSISGLHVTVFAALAGSLAFLLARQSPRLTTRIPARKVAVVAGTACAFGYVLLAGAEIPAMRTLLMLVVGAVGIWLARPGTALVVWLSSLAVVLLWDPWAPLSPGAWLSFGAVALLLFAGSGRLTRAVPPSRRVRLARILAEGMRTQWIVTIGLVPGTLALFQQVSLVSAFANAIAIPMVTLAIVPLTLTGIAIPIDAIFAGAHALTAALMMMLEALSAWPSAVWAQHAPPLWAVVAATIGVALLLVPSGVPGRWLGTVWLLPLALVTPLRPVEGGFRLTTLDVGQGLAVVIETAKHTLLYDAGPRFGNGDAGERIVAPFLRSAGILRLDAMVVSHQDLDHAGGALSVMHRVPLRSFWSSLPFDNSIVTRAASEATAWRCSAGQAWTWDGVRFSVLFPPIARYAEGSTKTNDLSCVVRVDGAFGSALLTGDIEARSEALLLEEARPLDADVITVPHHGSRTSSTPAFVAAAAPRVAVFSVGYQNRFGHPRADVAARYADIGARTMRTDRDGAVTMTLDGNRSALPVAERERRRRYWYDAPDADVR